MNKELLPFDLALWQTGEYDVCTAVGLAVRDLKIEDDPDYPIRAVLEEDEGARVWRANGQFFMRWTGALDLRLVRKTTCDKCGQKLPEKKWRELFIGVCGFNELPGAWLIRTPHLGKGNTKLILRQSDAGDIEVRANNEWVRVGGGE